MNLFSIKLKFLLQFFLLLFIFFCLKGQDNENNNQPDKTDTYSFIENKYKNRKSALTVSLYANSMNVTLWDKKVIDGKTGCGLQTSFEYKLIKRHSVRTGTQLYISNKKYECLKFFGTYRFYHNLNTRIQLGKTGDNFSANYFFIEPAYFIERSPYQFNDYEWDFDKGEWKLTYKKNVFTYARIWIGYGLQRCFTSNFYFDLNAGFDFQDIDNINSPYFHLYFFTQLSFGYIIH